MKIKKILSLAIACALVLSSMLFVPAEASTGVVEETVGIVCSSYITSCNDLGSGNWTVTDADSRNSASYGFCLESYDINADVAYDSAKGDYTKDSIIRYSADITTAVAMKNIVLSTNYNKNGAGVDTYQTMQSLKPAAGQKFRLDYVYDMNTTTIYWYVDKVLVKQNDISADADNVNPIEVTHNTIMLSPTAGDLGAGAKVADLTNIKKYTYPAGTTYDDVYADITYVSPVSTVDIVYVTTHTTCTDDGTGKWTLTDGRNDLNSYGYYGFRFESSDVDVDVPYDAAKDDYIKDSVVRYSAQITPAMAMGAVNLYVEYKKNGTQVLKEMPFTNLKPAAGQTFNVDFVYDSNTTTAYWYYNKLLVDTLDLSDGANKVDPIEFLCPYILIRVATNKDQTQGTKIAEVKNVTRHKYPEGTTASDAYADIADITPSVTPVRVDRQLSNTSFLDNGNGSYVFGAATDLSNFGFYIDTTDMNIDINYVPGKASYSNDTITRYSFEVTPSVNITKTALCTYFKRNGAQDHNYSTKSIALSAGKTYKFDLIYDSNTATEYWYVDKNMVYTTNFASGADNVNPIEILYPTVIFTLASNLAAGNNCATVSNVNKHIYAPGTTYADVDAEITYVQPVTSYIPSFKDRNNSIIATNGDMTTVSVASAFSDGSATQCFVELPAAVNVATPTYKYVSVSADVSANNDKLDYLFAYTMDKNYSEKNRIMPENTLSIVPGMKHNLDFIVDVVNKKGYFYLNNSLYSGIDIELDKISELLFETYIRDESGEAGSVTLTFDNCNVTYYTADATETLDAVRAKVLESDAYPLDFVNAYWYNGKGKHGRFVNLKTIQAIPSDYRVYVGLYEVAEDGSETFVKAIEFTGEGTVDSCGVHTYSNSASLPVFNKAKVFVWESNIDPLMKAIDLPYYWR